MLPRISSKSVSSLFCPINIRPKLCYLKDQLKNGAVKAAIVVLNNGTVTNISKNISTFACKLLISIKNLNRVTENEQPIKSGSFSIRFEPIDKQVPLLHAFGRKICYPHEISDKERNMLNTLDIVFNEKQVSCLNELIPKFNLNKITSCYLRNKRKGSSRFDDCYLDNPEKSHTFSKIISSFENLKELHLKCFADYGKAFPIILFDLVKRNRRLTLLEVDLRSPKLKGFAKDIESSMIKSIKEAIRNATSLKKLILYGATANTLSALMENNGLKNISQIPCLDFNIKPCLFNKSRDDNYIYINRHYDRTEARIGTQLAKFFEKIRADVITEINLNYQIIGSEATSKLANFISSSKILNNLFLENCDIDDANVIKLTNALQNNRSIEVLNLKKNKITKTGMDALAKVLLCNNTLRILDLSGTKQNESTMRDFIKSLKNNRALRALRLSLSTVGSGFARSISEVFKSNKTLMHLKMKIESIERNDYLRIRVSAILNKSPPILRIPVKRYDHNDELQKVVRKATKRIKNASNISTVVELSPLISSMMIYPYSEKDWPNELTKYVLNVLDKTLKDNHTRDIVKKYLIAQLAPSLDSCEDKKKVKEIALFKMKELCCDRLNQIMDKTSFNRKLISKKYRASYLKLMTSYFSSLITDNVPANLLKDRVWGTKEEQRLAKNEATKLLALLKFPAD